MTASARPLRIWVTRAEPGATATAARLRGLGHTALVSPLVATRPLPQPPPDLARVSRLAFTSAAGVRAFAGLTGARGTPVFAVGASTAEAARAAGWRDVRDADGDGRALAALIALEAGGAAGEVLVPGPSAPAFDVPAALGAEGIAARALPVYETVRLEPDAATVAAVHAGRVDAVLLQSASAARALDGALPDGPLVTPSPWALAQATSCRPAGPHWRIRTAAAPRMRDLLALLPALDAAEPDR